ncbi:MAG: GNAT family N-acetyltransferase [Candidatus Magasanikbacteria bacterium]|nr:GNAT family N-acetyltransferase [Candidatus Magasanikbacteria bacterium]
MRILKKSEIPIRREKISGEGVKLFIKKKNQEIARVFLYILKNDLHKEPFGFLEDLFVVEEKRGGGLGTKLIKAVVELARQKKCYKLVATSRFSRPAVHKLYQRLGFKKHGAEFRIDF